MSHNLTEAATYDANVTVPDPGDNRTAASVITAFQALADRTAWIKAQFATAASFGGTVDVASTSLFHDHTQWPDGGAVPKVYISAASIESDSPVVLTDELVLAGTSLIPGGAAGTGGRIRYRVVNAPDSNNTFTAKAQDIINIPSTVAGTNNQYTIDHTGAAVGHRIIVCNFSAQVQGVLDSVAGLLITLAASPSGTGSRILPTIAELVYLDNGSGAAVWHLLDH